MANRSELAILDQVRLDGLPETANASDEIESTYLQAIAAQPKNTKLYGKRCTARIELRLYAEALEDAKALVRLLPEAPVVSLLELLSICFSVSIYSNAAASIGRQAMATNRL